MDDKSQTRYLTIKFIYASRILNIHKDLIVSKKTKLKALYDDIEKRLTFNHRKENTYKYFYMFCNSKLCEVNLQETLDDIFGINNYEINVILTKHFFDTNNLINNYSKKTKPKTKTVKVDKEKIKEISSYQYLGHLIYNESKSDKSKLTVGLFKKFLKLQIREEGILIKILMNFANSHYSDGINDLKKDYEDIINIVNNELNSNFRIKNPYMRYYVGIFFTRQLSALLSDNSNKKIIIENENAVEEYGIKINHMGCIAEQEFRKLIVDDSKLYLFLNYIEKENLQDDIQSLYLIQKYLSKMKPNKTKLHKLLINEIKDYTYLPDIVSYGGGKFQQGGDNDSFQLIRRALEIQGEPRHDFGKIGRTALKNIDRDFPGIDTDEDRELSRIIRYLKNNFNIDQERLNVGNHESKYFIKYFKNIKFFTNQINEINSKFRYFRFNPDNFTIKIYDNEISGLTLNSAESITGIKSVKNILIRDNIKHYLFDTSGSITGTSCIKECLKGKFIECTNRVGIEDTFCKVLDKDITEVTPLCKLWDPSSSNYEKFITNYREALSEDDKYALLLKSLFMNNFDSPDEFRLSEAESREWMPIRDNLKDMYQVTYKQDSPEKKIISISLKNRGDPINFTSGLSVSEIGWIINKITDRSYTIAALESNIRNRKIKYKGENTHEDQNYNSVTELTRYLIESISSNAIKKKVAIRMLLDMKKSGDWSLIKWVQINNNHFKENHKTVLYTGDILCSLFSILNSNPTIFGTTSTLALNPFTLPDGEDIKFLVNRTMGYFSGTERILLNSDINIQLQDLSVKLFGWYNKARGEYYDLTDVDSDDCFSWTREDYINIISKQFPRITGLLSDTHINRLFIGSESIFFKLNRKIGSYYKNPIDSDDRKKDSSLIKQQLQNLIIIVNIFKNLESMDSSILSKVKLVSQHMFPLMLDFTSSYLYSGLNIYTTDTEKIFLSKEIQENIKKGLINIAGLSDQEVSKDKLPDSFTYSEERPTRTMEAVSDSFENIKNQIQTNLGDVSQHILGEHCFSISSGLTERGISTPELKLRMGHFIKDLDKLLHILMSLETFMDVFDRFPSIVQNMFEDIENMMLLDTKDSTTIQEIMKFLISENLKNLYGSTRDSELFERLFEIRKIKKIYECFYKLIHEQTSKSGYNRELADIFHTDEISQKNKIIEVLDKIDSLSSGLEFYFGDMGNIHETA